jgi:hypothetical protein
VSDIYAVPDSGKSSTSGGRTIVNVNGTAFFAALDLEHGREL